MRPQRNAAENGAVTLRRELAWGASMRPQRNAAENGALTFGQTLPVGASMRPQRNAAENLVVIGPTPRRRRRFNEAAA